MDESIGETIGESKSRSSQNPHNLYRIFGLTISSDYSFANRLLPGFGSPDLTFSCSDVAPISDNWLDVAPCYGISGDDKSSERILSVHRLEDCHIVHYSRIVDFYIWPDRIVAHLLDPSIRYIVEIRLLGEILSLWLELNGVLALHSSAVVAGGKAVAFLSTNHGGKSAIAASLMQKGHQLLTDDILPICERNGLFFGRAGYPQMRMWPDEAEYFLGHYSDLEIVHPWYTKRRVDIGRGGFGAFCGEERPMGAIYIPIRDELANDEIQIETVSPGEGIIELVRNSFSPFIVEALGLQKKRMELFRRLVLNVPIRKLHYPSGFDHLQRVRAAIVDDIRNL
jgi:hypothetical protein